MRLIRFTDTFKKVIWINPDHVSFVREEYSDMTYIEMENETHHSVYGSIREVIEKLTDEVIGCH